MASATRPATGDAVNSTNNTNNCGLHHLVEAATALTQLVSSVPQAQQQSNHTTSMVTTDSNLNANNSNSHTISDDEDNMKAQQARVATQAQISKNGHVNVNSYANIGASVASNTIPIAPNGALPMALLNGNSNNSNTMHDHQKSFVQTQSHAHAHAALSQSLHNSLSSTSPSPSSSTSPSSQNQHTPCIREIFPQRLMRILSDSSISDIITWLPHGKSFVIIQQEVLSSKVLPKYFPESASAAKKAKSSSTSTSTSAACKYPSFTRKLNRWGFRQVTRGPDAGAFHHKFFCRDEPRLCLQMICQRSRRRKGDDKMVGGTSAAIPSATGVNVNVNMGANVNVNLNGGVAPNPVPANGHAAVTALALSNSMGLTLNSLNSLNKHNNLVDHHPYSSLSLPPVTDTESINSSLSRVASLSNFSTAPTPAGFPNPQGGQGQQGRISNLNNSNHGLSRNPPHGHGLNYTHTHPRSTTSPPPAIVSNTTSPTPRSKFSVHDTNASVANAASNTAGTHATLSTNRVSVSSNNRDMTQMNIVNRTPTSLIQAHAQAQAQSQAQAQVQAHNSLAINDVFLQHNLAAALKNHLPLSGHPQPLPPTLNTPFGLLTMPPLKESPASAPAPVAVSVAATSSINVPPSVSAATTLTESSSTGHNLTTVNVAAATALMPKQHVNINVNRTVAVPQGAPVPATAAPKGTGALSLSSGGGSKDSNTNSNSTSSRMEDDRIASAKSMLYSAYLNALG